MVSRYYAEVLLCWCSQRILVHRFCFMGFVFVLVFGWYWHHNVNWNLFPHLFHFFHVILFLFFFFLKIFWRTGIDSFTDIWFTLWTDLKWLKWVFYSFVIYLVRYSVSSWVIFYSLCVCRSLYYWSYLFVGKVVHRISYLFYFSKVYSDFSFYSWTGHYIFSCLFVFPVISLVKNLSI